MVGHVPNNADKLLQLVNMQIMLETTVGVLEGIMGGTMAKATTGACKGGQVASSRVATPTGVVAALVIQVVLLLKRL